MRVQLGLVFVAWEACSVSGQKYSAAYRKPVGMWDDEKALLSSCSRVTLTHHSIGIRSEQISTTSFVPFHKRSTKERWSFTVK